MTRRVRTAIAAGGFLLGALGLAAGCGSTAKNAAGGDLTVFAAASLQQMLPAEITAFTSAHPGAHIVVSYAGSQALAAQLRQGAPADVAAFADQKTLSQVSDATASSVLARNRLAIVVASGNPRHVTGLSSLTRRDLTVVLAAPSVPAGKYAKWALDAAHLLVRPATTTDNVTAVVTDVRLGQADAGIVYVTDVTGVSGVQTVAIPAAQNVVATYPVAVLGRSKHHARAAAFVDFLRSPTGQHILTTAGFSAA